MHYDTNNPFCTLLDIQVMVLFIYIVVLLALCLAPLTFTCPCIMDRHSLKPQPSVIGRRGAPMVSWGFARLYYLIHLIVQIGSLWRGVAARSTKCLVFAGFHKAVWVITKKGKNRKKKMQEFFCTLCTTNAVYSYRTQVIVSGSV